MLGVSCYLCGASDLRLMDKLAEPRTWRAGACAVRHRMTMRSSLTVHGDDSWPQLLSSSRDPSLARHSCTTAAHNHRTA